VEYYPETVPLQAAGMLTQGVGQALALGITAIMVARLGSPFWVASSYLVFRPLLQPYTEMHFALGGVPLSAFSSVVILAATMYSCLLKARYTMFPRVALYPYLLFVVFILTLFYTVDYASTAWFLAKYATSLCLLILSFNAIDEKEDFLLFAKVLILGSVVPILFGFYQKVTGYVFPWHEGKWWLDAGRISSLFGRWNEYGIYLSIILVLLTCVIINEEKTGRRWKWILWSGLAAISFVISLNRGSWIALALGFLVAFFAHMRRIQIRWYVIGTILVLIFGLGIIMKRFTELHQVSVDGNTQNTFAGRIEYWILLIKLAFKRYLLGWGAGTAVFLAEKKLNSDLPPHNDYIRLLLESGVVSVILYLLFMLKNLVKALGNSKWGEGWKTHYSMLIIFVYFPIISFPQNIIDNIILFPLYLSVVGAYWRYCDIQHIARSELAIS
jgi:O-antigen ligase